MKVLKSFATAHEAVRWLSNNPIEGVSIEMTRSLKSAGHAGSLPSGNYHVVLKGKARDLVEGVRMGEKVPLNVAERVTVAPETLEAIAKRKARYGDNPPGALEAPIRDSVKEMANLLGVKTPMGHSEGVEPGLSTREKRLAYIQDKVSDALEGRLAAGDKTASIKSIVEEAVYEVLKGYSYPLTKLIKEGPTKSPAVPYSNVPITDETGETVVPATTFFPFKPPKGFMVDGEPAESGAYEPERVKVSALKSIVEEAVYEVLKGLESQ